MYMQGYFFKLRSVAHMKCCFDHRHTQGDCALALFLSHFKLKSGARSSLGFYHQEFHKSWCIPDPGRLMAFQALPGPVLVCFLWQCVEAGRTNAVCKFLPLRRLVNDFTGVVSTLGCTVPPWSNGTGGATAGHRQGHEYGPGVGRPHAGQGFRSRTAKLLL